MLRSLCLASASHAGETDTLPRPNLPQPQKPWPQQHWTWTAQEQAAHDERLQAWAQDTEQHRVLSPAAVRFVWRLLDSVVSVLLARAAAGLNAPDHLHGHFAADAEFGGTHSLHFQLAGGPADSQRGDDDGGIQRRIPTLARDAGCERCQACHCWLRTGGAQGLRFGEDMALRWMRPDWMERDAPADADADATEGVSSSSRLCLPVERIALAAIVEYLAGSLIQLAADEAARTQPQMTADSDSAADEAEHLGGSIGCVHLWRAIRGHSEWNALAHFAHAAFEHGTVQDQEPQSNIHGSHNDHPHPFSFHAALMDDRDADTRIETRPCWSSDTKLVRTIATDMAQQLCTADDSSSRINHDSLLPSSPSTVEPPAVIALRALGVRISDGWVERVGPASAASADDHGSQSAEAPPPLESACAAGTGASAATLALRDHHAIFLMRNRAEQPCLIKLGWRTQTEAAEDGCSDQCCPLQEPAACCGEYTLTCMEIGESIGRAQRLHDGSYAVALDSCAFERSPNLRAWCMQLHTAAAAEATHHHSLAATAAATAELGSFGQMERHAQALTALLQQHAEAMRRDNEKQAHSPQATDADAAPGSDSCSSSSSSSRVAVSFGSGSALRSAAAAAAASAVQGSSSVLPSASSSSSSSSVSRYSNCSLHLRSLHQSALRLTELLHDARLQSELESHLCKVLACGCHTWRDAPDSRHSQAARREYTAVMLEACMQQMVDMQAATVACDTVDVGPAVASSSASALGSASSFSSSSSSACVVNLPLDVWRLVSQFHALDMPVRATT